MIGAIFEYGNDKVEVRVQDLNCYFRTSDFAQFATIDGIKLDKKGAVKEFPDLKDREDWKEETIKRFKEKLKQMETESQRIKYVISDLTKHGYKPLFIQRAGFRPVKI
jgi:uncharacterized protein YfcZ (UPF0381/DUF406 family)